MTTYQDPPLQSRRAVRQGERPEPQQPSSPFAPPQVPRNASGAGEPLSYVTQNRPPLPGYEGAAGRRAEQEPAGQPAPPEFPASEQPANSFRPRDYSPEARSAPPAWVPEDDRESGHVDYRTQARANVVPPASLASSLSGEPSEQTFTRRELRALRDAQGLVEQPAAPAAPVAPAQQVAPVAPPAPAPSTQLDSAMAEFDVLTGRSGVPAPAADDPSRRAGRRAAAPTEAAPEDGLAVFDAVVAPPAAPTPLIEPADRQTHAAPAQPVAPPQPIAPQSFAPPIAPPPVAPAQPAPQPQAVVLPPEPAPMAPVAFTPPQAPVPAEPPAAGAPAAVEPVAPITGERPVGHWTTQSDLDDRTQINESTISRTVGAGSGAITTSALVLPSIPGQHMETGEVMLTGSLSLPASLAATGAHHSIDESDLDHLLDPGDHQAINTDSVPIRAIRAVSSHTNSSNPLLTAAKPNRGGRALTALIVSASGMVVVVVTLLVVALVNGGL